MSLFVLEAILWIFGIRGQVPQDDGFPYGRGSASLAANGRPLVRLLIAAIVSIGLLSLALWAAVWLAIQLL
jgi:hypothetical protein